MTQQASAWMVAWLCVLAGVTPALAGDGQRARSRTEAPAGQEAATATAAAHSRSDDRRAEHGRPTEAPAKDRAPGPVVVTPVVMTPTPVGGFTVGKPVVVGTAFAVGHVPRETQDSKGGGRGHDRHPSDGYPPSIVTVPVYVPVYIESQTVITETVTVPATAPAPVPADDPGVRTGFSPWYTVADGLMAGLPIPMPPADTFVERNISDSVAEPRTMANAAGSVAPREYAKSIGGISFDIAPADVAVFVDGRFVGSVDDFAPDQEPLLLRFGGYTVELRADGYRTVRFLVSVSMGEVMPFKGTLSKIER